MRALTETTVYFNTVPGQLKKRCIYWVSRLKLMYAVYGERRAMRSLSDETLSDIGINRGQLRRECSSSLTELPERRIR